MSSTSEPSSSAPARPFAVTTIPASTAPGALQLEPYQLSYLQLALSSSILKFGGPFTLKSGRKSPYFFNAGLFDSGSKIDQLASCYAKAIVSSKTEFDVIFGPAYKGIPLAAATALALHRDHGIDVGFCFNRKEAKTHGEGGSLVGASLEGKRVLVVDDVITAGTAINEAVGIIQAAPGATLVAVVIALDRQEVANEEVGESAIQIVEKTYGIKVHSVVNLDQIISYMEGRGGFEENIASMKEYRSRYGIKKV